MTVPVELVPALKDLIGELVRGNYTQLEADGRAGRLSADEIEQAIASYGCTLVEIPDEVLRNTEAIPIESEGACWAVDVDLWTREGGRSDLTLSLTMCLTAIGVETEIEDLHML